MTNNKTSISKKLQAQDLRRANPKGSGVILLPGDTSPPDPLANRAFGPGIRGLCPLKPPLFLRKADSNWPWAVGYVFPAGLNVYHLIISTMNSCQPIPFFLFTGGPSPQTPRLHKCIGGDPQTPCRHPCRVSYLFPAGQASRRHVLGLIVQCYVSQYPFLFINISRVLYHLQKR